MNYEVLNTTNVRADVEVGSEFKLIFSIKEIAMLAKAWMLASLSDIMELDLTSSIKLVFVGKDVVPTGTGGVSNEPMRFVDLLVAGLGLANSENTDATFDVILSGHDLEMLERLLENRIQHCEKERETDIFVQESNVDLPDPEGPIKATYSPWLISSYIRLSTVELLYGND
jgi:hypothetical protein